METHICNKNTETCMRIIPSSDSGCLCRAKEGALTVYISNILFIKLVWSNFSSF